MSQTILLLSIWNDKQPRIGEPDLVYNAKCTGRQLSNLEVLRQNLATSKELAYFSASRMVHGNGLSWHRSSGEIAEWYQVNPGDKITFVIYDFEDAGETPDGTYEFIIPEGGLPDPPVRVDDPRLPNGPHKYYLEHATRVS